MIKLKKLVKEETSLIKEGTRWNVGIEAQSKNRGRAEKSRLKKEGKEFTDSQLASRIAYHANLHKGTGVGYANAFGQLAVFLRDIGYKKSFIEAVKVMKVLAKKKRVESVVEDHIKFTKEEMVQLHKDGKIEKGGHTIEFGESVNEATVSGTDKAVKFWQDMFRPGPIPKEYINQLIKKKGVLPSKSHIKAIYRANKNPSSKDLEKAWKGLVKDKYVRAASGLWRWNKQFESVNEAKIAHSKGGYIEVGKWYLFNYGKWKTPNDQWKYIIPMNMIKKKKIGGYMTPLKESVNEGFTKYHIRLTDTPGWYGVWDKNGKQKFEGDRRYVMRQLKKLKTRMGNVQLKSLIDVATKRKGKNIEFDVVESVNEAKESGIDIARRVVKNKQHEKGLDLTTANFIVKIYDAYKEHPNLQRKLDKMPLSKMVKLAYRVMK